MVALSPNYYLFAFGRFLVGFFVPGGITMFILLCEVTGPSQRSLLAVSQAAVFGLGYGVMALIAYFVPHWRWFTAATAMMTSVFVLFSGLGFICPSAVHSLLLSMSLLHCRYIPESPRWLLVNGREMDAKNTLLQIAKVNNRMLPSGFSLNVPPKPSKSFNFVALFSNTTMRLRMLLQMLEWYCLLNFNSL